MAQTFAEHFKTHFTWKRAALAVAALFILYLLIQALMPNPVPADVAGVERGNIEVTVHGEGKTRVREVYVISTPVTGRLLRIEAEPGDQVDAHETVIAAIEPTDPNFTDIRTGAQAEARIKAARAGLELAKAQLESREAELAFARQELERTRNLFEKGYATRQLLDTNERNVRMAAADVDTSRHNVQVSEFDLESAKAALNPPPGVEVEEGSSTFILKAPVDGKVLRVLQESEQVVQAGTPLVEIGDLRDLEIVADLLSTDAVKVSQADFVHVDHWGGAHEVEGRVRLVEPSGFTKISALGVEEQRVNVIVDFIGAPEKIAALGDAFRVEVYIVVESKADVVLAPVSALFRRDDTWYVFKLESGEARLTQVEIGLRNDDYVEILSGLSEGETVIIHPSNVVDDGVPIRVR